MRAIVLGSAAGGGFPQWNDNTAASRRARRGDPTARPRSQASLAVSANERDWFILNASPDLRQQIEATPVLHPRDGLRSSPIAGVVLTGGDVDAIAGLLHLRERHRFTIYAPAGAGDPRREPDFRRAWPRIASTRLPMPLDRKLQLAGHAGNSGLGVEAFGVPGKKPLYLEGEGFDPTPREDGDVIGLAITETATGRTLLFIPGCAAMTDRLRRRLTRSDLVFFDGTLWTGRRDDPARGRGQDRAAHGTS